MRITYKQTVAIIYAIVLFLDRLDLTIINITLPTIAKYFNIPIITTDWINLAFLIALAISIPISSWLGEYFGFKKIYVIAIALFGLGSTLCIFAPNLEVLIALRFLQGIGGGLLVPTGMTLLYRIYEKSEYASITSFTFIPSLIAPAIAPFFGGILLAAFGWRIVFAFSGPISLLLSIAAIALLKEDEFKLAPPLDWLGFLLSSALLIDVFYTLSKVGREGVNPTFFILLLSIAIITFLFLFVENRLKNPLIDLSFFKNRTFVKANLMQLCFQICHFGAIFIIGMYLQIGVGFSAMMAGLIMGTQAISAMIFSRYSVRLYNIYGAELPVMIGFAGIAVVSPMILLIKTTHMIVFGIILFFVRGIFSGLCGTPIQTLSVCGFHKENLSKINGIFNSCRQVSISLGVAISAILIAIRLKSLGMYTVFQMSSQQAFDVFS